MNDVQRIINIKKHVAKMETSETREALLLIAELLASMEKRLIDQENHIHPEDMILGGGGADDVY